MLAVELFHVYFTRSMSMPLLFRFFKSIFKKIYQKKYSNQDINRKKPNITKQHAAC